MVKHQLLNHNFINQSFKWVIMVKFQLNPPKKPRGPKNSGKRKNFGHGGDSRESGRSDHKKFNKFSKGSSDRPERTEVTCDSCGKKCEVPFKPRSNKPIYCDNCFRKDSGSGRSSGSSGSGSKDLAEINKKLDRIIKALELD
jgi:CxxC-x17-CxxC domain-containing protein